MSRGLGRVQKRIVAVLAADEGSLREGMTRDELGARIGAEEDRSNVRRAIRTLIGRGHVEVIKGDDGRERLKLEFLTAVAATMPPAELRVDPLAEFKARRVKFIEQARERALERERVRKEAIARHRRRRPLRRRRRLGPVQRRILSVLRQGIDGEFRALETTYLKSLVGGDRSNLRRAIWGLLERGYIVERTVDGRRYYELTLLGYHFAVPLDLATAPRLEDPP
jgi:hypothetical protein